LQKFCARIAAPWDLFIAHSGWAQHYVNVNVSINYPANTMNLAGFCDGAFHIFKKARRQNIAGPLPTDKSDNPKRPHQREKEREREKKQKRRDR